LVFTYTLVSLSDKPRADSLKLYDVSFPHSREDDRP